ncbi:endonuclease/exonuclease/phosphatase family protein [Pontiellaceae bacterium B1224]|nr:endonuclease/exonuclease/phosphatase family protein [Pontiellaceae bacterium B1224]
MLKLPPHINLFRHFDRIIWYAVAGLTVATLLGFLGRLNWMLELFSHFRVQYLQIALLLAGICLWVRRNKCASALAAVAALNYIFILPLYLGKPSAPNTKPVRAMLMNINAQNGNTAQVIYAITNASPDLIVLEEVTPHWAFELSQLATNYPHHIMEPQEGCFGIMLLSRYPLAHGEIVEIGNAGVPSIITEVHFPEGAVSVIATHPLPPITASYARERNGQLEALSAVVKQQKYPVLLIGDLNVTTWSPYFQTLVKESGLKDSMKGFGFQPSWAANFFLKIPIDHMLHASEINIHNRQIGPDIGSDHFPVIVDFTLK